MGVTRCGDVCVSVHECQRANAPAGWGMLPPYPHRPLDARSRLAPGMSGNKGSGSCLPRREKVKIGIVKQPLTDGKRRAEDSSCILTPLLPACLKSVWVSRSPASRVESVTNFRLAGWWGGR